MRPSPGRTPLGSSFLERSPFQRNARQRATAQAGACRGRGTQTRQRWETTSSTASAEPPLCGTRGSSPGSTQGSRRIPRHPPTQLRTRGSPTCRRSCQWEPTFWDFGLEACVAFVRGTPMQTPRRQARSRHGSITATVDTAPTMGTSRCNAPSGFRSPTWPPRPRISLAARKIGQASSGRAFRLAATPHRRAQQTGGTSPWVPAARATQRGAGRTILRTATTAPRGRHGERNTYTGHQLPCGSIRTCFLAHRIATSPERSFRRGCPSTGTATNMPWPRRTAAMEAPPSTFLGAVSRARSDRVVVPASGTLKT
mmetsp:Transcript_33615/g.101581  ORF Transcript_33615/g.101581 Transcript_33615/m.101581 type:complete len:312 (+) Transcript_33615:185-1120(+)